MMFVICVDRGVHISIQTGRCGRPHYRQAEDHTNYLYFVEMVCYLSCYCLYAVVLEFLLYYAVSDGTEERVVRSIIA